MQFHWLNLLSDNYRSLEMKDVMILWLKFILLVRIIILKCLIWRKTLLTQENQGVKIGITNLHHYKVECLYTIIDLQLQEFNDRFDSELLICMASLSPIDSFVQFDKSLLVRLAELYPDDFTCVERRSLEQQLDIYLDNVKKMKDFLI